MGEITFESAKKAMEQMEIRIDVLEKENSQLVGQLQSKKSQLDGINNLLNQRNQQIVEYQEKLNKVKSDENLVRILSDEVKDLRRENEKYRNTIVWFALNAQFPNLSTEE